MPANTEQLNYVINFTTEYKNKGLEQARADLGRFQAQAQEALGVKAIHSGGTVQTASTKYMGYGASGKYGYISRGMAEGQVSAQIGKSYEASLANIQNQFKGGTLTVSAYRKALTNLQLTYQKSVLDVDKLDKSSSNFLNTQTKLAMRAIAVIPIWMALRTAYMEVFNTINEGVSTIISLDRELARIKTVTTDVSDMSGFLGELGQKALKMSADTGLAVEDILHAFYGFKDAGLTTEVAMAGMETSVKGSIALFGDLKETAKTLTDVYVLMGDRITKVNTPQEKMNYIMSSIAVLQRTNKFELNEYMEGLKTFAGTATAANLSLDQMAFLLAKTHTFMQRGSRGGTDLSNALRKLSQNAEKAEIFLGKPINLSGTSRFELMLEIMDKLNVKMSKGQDITKNINDMFGIRGTAAINAFTINLKSVIEQWKEFSDLSPERRMEIWMDQFNTAGMTIERQVARLQKIKSQLGANFIAGILGIDLSKTRDAAEGIKTINDKLQELIPTVKALGDILKPVMEMLILLGSLKGGKAVLGLAAKHPIIAGITATKGALSFAKGQQENLWREQENRARKGGIEGKSLEDVFGKDILNAIDPEIYQRYKKAWQDGVDNGIQVKKSKTEINQVNQLNIDQEEDLSKLMDFRLLQLDKLKSYGFSEIAIEREKLKLLLERNDASVKDEDIQKQRLAILKLQNNEIIKYSETLQSNVASTFNDILSGKGGNVFNTVTNTIGESFRTTISEGLSKTLIGATGFGEFFGETMQGLKGQVESGHKVVYDLIKRGHIDGLNASRISATASWAGSQSALTASNGAPVVMGPSGMLITGTSGEVMPGYGVPSGGRKGSFGGNLLTGKNKTANTAAQSGLLGYSAYSSAKSSGSNTQSAIGQGLMAAGSMGAMGALSGAVSAASGYAATSLAVGGSFSGMGALGAGLAAIGPVGWIALAAVLIGGILAATSKGKKQESIESRTSTSTISSKINVTNKQLELVNRNLIALRTDIRTYILPNSSYFSAKSSLDEEFSISSRMASVE